MSLLIVHRRLPCPPIFNGEGEWSWRGTVYLLRALGYSFTPLRNDAWWKWSTACIGPDITRPITVDLLRPLTDLRPIFLAPAYYVKSERHAADVLRKHFLVREGAGSLQDLIQVSGAIPLCIGRSGWP
jgi:hypothetical protein